MDVDELLAGGVRAQPLVEGAGPLVWGIWVGTDVKMPSLDVLALQMIEELGPQAPRLGASGGRARASDPGDDRP